jgi:hypothetical protein
MAVPTPSFDNGWSVPDHDYQAHSGATSNHGPTQILYKKGGASGKLVATETITYDGNHVVATRSIVWEKDVYM